MLTVWTTDVLGSGCVKYCVRGAMFNLVFRISHSKSPQVTSDLGCLLPVQVRCPNWVAELYASVLHIFCSPDISTSQLLMDPHTHGRFPHISPALAAAFISNLLPGDFFKHFKVGNWHIHVPSYQHINYQLGIPFKSTPCSIGRRFIIRQGSLTFLSLWTPLAFWWGGGYNHKMASVAWSQPQNSYHRRWRYTYAGSTVAGSKRSNLKNGKDECERE